MGEAQAGCVRWVSLCVSCVTVGRAADRAVGARMSVGGVVVEVAGCVGEGKAKHT